MIATRESDRARTKVNDTQHWLFVATGLCFVTDRVSNRLMILQRVPNGTLAGVWQRLLVIGAAHSGQTCLIWRTATVVVASGSDHDRRDPMERRISSAYPPRLLIALRTRSGKPRGAPDPETSSGGHRGELRVWRRRAPEGRIPGYSGGKIPVRRRRPSSTARGR